MIKIYAAIAGTLIVLGGAWGFWYNVHTKPVKILKNEVKDLKEIRDIYEIEINNLGVQLKKCKDGALATDFEAYYEGGGGIEEDTNSTGSNIFLKRVH